MRCKSVSALIAIVACLTFGGVGAADAQCTIPNLISNGQTSDATPVMGDFNALLNCIENPEPSANKQFSGAGGGIVTMQNPSATTDYNFNLPATAGNAGDLLTSGGGVSSPETWTSTGTSGHSLPFLDGNNSWSGTQTFGPVVGTVSTQSGTAYTLAAGDCGTTIIFTNSSPITLTTLNSLPTGCAVGIEQAGNGQVAIRRWSNHAQSG